MFTLVAASRKPIIDGIVATEQYATLEDAEKEMSRWGRFGVQNQCNEADAIYICDRRGRLVSKWDFAARTPVRA